MISTPVNEEISNYHEKFFLGLSIRQLICLSLAIVVAGCSTALCFFVFHVSTEYLGYIIMLGCSPLLAVGWLRPKGLPFEKYAKIWFKWQLNKQQLPIQQKEHKHVWKKTQKIRECPSIADPGDGAKAARKTAAAAKKEIRRTERGLHSENIRSACTKKGS